MMHFDTTLVHFFWLVYYEIVMHCFALDFTGPLIHLA